MFSVTADMRTSMEAEQGTVVDRGGKNNPYQFVYATLRIIPALFIQFLTGTSKSCIAVSRGRFH